MKVLSKIFLLMVLVAAPRIALAASQTPYLVFDYKSGTIYAEQKPFDRWYPASLTKLMTAYTVLKIAKTGLIDLNSPVKVSAYALSQPPSKMGFPVNTRLNLDNALKIIMVKSSNDIAVAIAESAAGTEQRFVDLMNRYAAEIGMDNSHFDNPHGLHSDTQFTSARDRGLLAKAILDEFPEHKNYFNISAIKFGGRTLRNHNRLMRNLADINGMKTGFTCPSGLNIVVYREHNQKHLIAVVLGMPSGKERNALAAKLLTNAENVNGKTNLGSFLDFKPKQAVEEPINLRPVVCVKKKKPKKPKAEYVMFYPLRNETLAEREARYYQTGIKSENIIEVKLGGTSGPDPFALNRDPISPSDLIAPLLSYSDATIPLQPENYQASVNEIEAVMVLSDKKFDLKKDKLPFPTKNPEREERLALARHTEIWPLLSYPDGSAPLQPEHYLTRIWNADWAPVQYRALFKLPDGKTITIPFEKSQMGSKHTSLITQTPG